MSWVEYDYETKRLRRLAREQKRLSNPMKTLLDQLKQYKFVRPGYHHMSTVKALFDRELIVATMGRKQGEHDGPWIRLRKTPYENDCRWLAK